jgi:PAS domain S-box-containing protein
MLNFFHRLKVSQKLMLISVFFMIPDTVLLCLFLLSINDNIRFAQSEQRGNEYQRPLEDLLWHLPDHLLLARRSADGPNPPEAELAMTQARIDQALAALEAVDARLGAELQFTDEGLSKRKREHCRVRNLKAEWQRLKTGLGKLDPTECEVQHQHLIADVRTMITHVGDTSNLILDPDLDSYYLMDVTLLALPQMQDRLATLTACGEAALKRGGMSADERRQFSLHAAMLKEADLDRVVASVGTALNEDANFYGTSQTLHRRVPPAVKEFTEASERFLQLTAHLSDAETAAVPLAEFLAAGSRARAASFVLWRVADEELDALLDKRIHSYRVRRARSLVLTALALLAAVSFVSFITHSISGPLQKQAAELRESNQALQAEVSERQRAEVALRTAEAKYRSIFENSVEGIFQTARDGRYLAANPTLARMYGYESAAELQAGLTATCGRLYVDPLRRTEFQRQIEQFGKVCRFESQAYRKDGTVIWISENARVVRDATGALLFYEGAVEDITERKRSEAELERVHRELVETSRQAGMAEVATGVLHNVGNVLNSVNVAASCMADSLRKSKAANLSKVVALLREHEADLGAFLTADAKGRQIPGYLAQLAEHLAGEQAAALTELAQLQKNIEHIKDIVTMQQTYAKVSGAVETLKAADLVEDALRMNSSSLHRHDVQVVKELEEAPLVAVDKHKVLQILVNLMRNAKQACDESGRAEKRLTLRVTNGKDRVRIAVSDNGVGISPDNLTRIFAHGFTTKKNGHGFGLHSGALAAKEMGGSLSVHSDGDGHGATFTLELPLRPPNNLYA